MLCMLGPVLSTAPLARRGVLTVTTAADVVDPKDGVLSLREAIAEAQDGDTITFDASLSGVRIVLGYNKGALTITKDVVIEGIGASGSEIAFEEVVPFPDRRVFEVAAGARVILSHLTIANGGGYPFGGPSGSGILNAGELTLRDSVVRSNYAAVSGGGIYNTGVLTLLRSTIRNNAARLGDGGGLVNAGGTVTIRDSTITSNASTRAGGGGGSGGGIANNSGTMLIIHSTLSKNSVDFGRGGGILNGGTLTLVDSTVDDNHTSTVGGGSGGGLYSGGTATLLRTTVSGNAAFESGGISNHGDLLVQNSTISGNSGSFGAGGLSSSNKATLRYSTVTNNQSNDPAPPAGNPYGGGGITVRGGTLTLQQTIVAGNRSRAANEADCKGPLLSLGANLVGAGTGCPSDGPGDLTVTPDTVFTAVLGPLADNGGPTATHALLPDSPARDAGSDDCPPPYTDQRGVARPQDGDGDRVAVCDIGAVEAEAVGVHQGDLRISQARLWPDEGRFTVRGTLVLSATSDGVAPRAEAVALTIGPQTLTIPAGALVQRHQRFTFDGTVGNVALELELRLEEQEAPSGRQGKGEAAAAFRATGQGADLEGVDNPVSVILTIGNDTGATRIEAMIK